MGEMHPVVTPYNIKIVYENSLTRIKHILVCFLVKSKLFKSDVKLLFNTEQLLKVSSSTFYIKTK